MKKKVLATLLAATLALGVMACGAEEAPAEETAAEEKTEEEETLADEQRLIGFAPPTMNNAFFVVVQEAVEAVVEANGDKLVTIDPQNDQARMNDQIGDMIAQGIDALLVCPFDSAGIEPVLLTCEEKGIPVVNWDTPVAKEDLVASIVASDNYMAGKLGAEEAMSLLPEGSKVAIFNCPGSGAADDRTAGFKETAGDYFEFVSELDSKGDTSVTLPQAEDILQSTPDLAAFWCLNDPAAIGCVNAIAARPEMSNVMVFGVDGNPDAKKMISEGKITATAAQSPSTVGEQSALTAYELIEGKEVEKTQLIDTFIINKDNVEEYGFDGWQ